MGHQYQANPVTSTPMNPPPSYQNPPSNPSPASSSSGGAASSDDIFAMIERLAKLRDVGAISDAEFGSKKAELLGRL